MKEFFRKLWKALTWVDKYVFMPVVICYFAVITYGYIRQEFSGYHTNEEVSKLEKAAYWDGVNITLDVLSLIVNQDSVDTKELANRVNKGADKYGVKDDSSR